MGDYLTISDRGAGGIRDSFANVNKSSNLTPKPDLGTSFADTLKNAVHEVNKIQKESDLSMQKFVTGQHNNIHDVMIKSEKADLALRLLVQVRNKIIDAYQEIMKMQV